MTFTRRHLLAGTAAGLSSLALSGGRVRAAPLETADPVALGFDPERLKRIPVALQRRVDAREAPGFLAAIVRDSKILHFSEVGYSDIASKSPMARDTIFRIMSMTKPIVSVAAMMLVEENKLRLTDPVAKYIPSFARSEVYVSGSGDEMETRRTRRQVQIRNLLMHTSGYSYGNTDNPVGQLHRERGVFVQQFNSLAEFCDAAAALPLMFEPGTQWQYGISTDILGHVIEKASGQSLPDFLQERIFDPLGMPDTAFVVPAQKAGRLVTTYKAGRTGLEVSDDPKTSPFLKPQKAPSGGGGLTSTADDYLRFAVMLANEGELDGVRLLGPETVRFMSANHLPKEYLATRDTGFGLGFGIDVSPASRNYYGPPGTYHWTGALRTHFWVDPVNRIVGLSMTQVEPANNKFEEDMRALVYQAFMG